MVTQCRKCGHKLEPLVYLEELYESTKQFEKAIDEVNKTTTKMILFMHILNKLFLIIYFSKHIY